jgi:hypothetical protein
MKKSTQMTAKLKVEIEKVVFGSEEEFQSDVLCADEVIRFIQEKYEDDYENLDFDTNGWQMDFWINLKVNNKKFILSGSGYYGGIKLQSIEEDNNEV